MAVAADSLLASGLAKLARNAQISVPEGMAVAAHVAQQNGAPGTGAAAPYAGFHRTVAGPGHLSGEGGTGGGGGSFWGDLKNLGTTALDALATPGNALLTAAGNLGLTIAGKPTIPWSDAYGAFHGRSPGQDILAHSGVGPGLARTLGGIGLDVGVDPLWLTGVGKLPVLAKETLAAAHALEGGAAVEHAGTALEHLGQVAHATRPDTALEHLPTIEHAGQDVHAVPGTEPAPPLVGGVVTPQTIKETMAGVRSKFSTPYTVPHEYAVRFGVGKLGENTRLARTFRTGIPTIGAKLSLVGKSGAELQKIFKAKFVNPPIMRVGRRLKVAAQDTEAGIRQAAENIGREHGLNPADAKRVGTYFAVRHADANAGSEVLHDMIKQGIWKPSFDPVIDVLDTHYGLMSKALGHYAASDVPRLLDEIKTHVAKGEDDEALFKAHVVSDLEGHPYAPSGRHADVTAELKDWMNNRDITGPMMKGGGVPGANPFLSRELPHAFAGMSRDDVAKQLEHELELTPEQASQLTDTIGSSIERHTGTPAFADETFRYMNPDQPGEPILNEAGEPIQYKPNLHALDLFSNRAGAQVKYELDHQIMSLMKEAGVMPNHAARVKSFLTQNPNPEMFPGSLSGTDIGRVGQKATIFLKKMFTVVLPAHGIRNAASDFQNTLANGNLWHFFTGPELGFSSRYVKLLRAERAGDQTILRRTFKIKGGRTYTGEELLAMGRLTSIGLGARGAAHSFVGEDIRAMEEMLTEMSKPRTVFGRYSRFMQQYNLDRDNAQRLKTWVNHMNGGDDMFTAAAKSLRTNFDYGDMTNFEKVWMRNLFLFYTWFRKNTALHATNLLQRPGLYAASQQIETGRPKFANEPTYMKTLGLLPTPVGNLAFGGAINDAINKLNLSQIRNSTVGQFTPLAQIPISLLTGSDITTGNPLPSHPVPSIFGYIPGLGTTASAYARGPIGRSIPPWAQEILGSISPSPVAATGAVSNAGYEGSKLGDIIGRLSGLQIMQNQPAKFAAIAAIKRSEARKQLATLKRYNVGSQP